MIENVTGHGQSRPRSRRGAEGQGAGPEPGRAIRLCSGRAPRAPSPRLRGPVCCASPACRPGVKGTWDCEAATGSVVAGVRPSAQVGPSFTEHLRHAGHRPRFWGAHVAGLIKSSYQKYAERLMPLFSLRRKSDHSEPPSFLAGGKSSHASGGIGSRQGFVETQGPRPQLDTEAAALVAAPQAGHPRPRWVSSQTRGSASCPSWAIRIFGRERQGARQVYGTGVP